MTDEQFENLIAEGIDQIPEEFGSKMDNVAIVVQDEPTPAQRHQLQLRPHSLLFGLYEGVPHTKRGANPWRLPDKITIFKNPILQMANTEEEIRKLVIDTVWHEVGHHFGLSESEVRAKQKKRDKKNGSHPS